MSGSLDGTCRLSLAAPELTLSVLGVRAQEALNRPARYVVWAALAPEEQEALEPLELFEQAVAQAACLSWGEPKPRQVHLVVDEVSLEHDGRIRLELVSPAAVLADSCDHRVFVEQDAVEIVTEVLARHSLRPEVRMQRKLQKRAQCAQSFESDLAFVQRLLAEEGINWHGSDADPAVVVLVDASAGFDRFEEGGFELRAPGGLREAEAVLSVHAPRLHQRATSDAAALRGFDFSHPSLDLSSRAQATEGELERYSYSSRYTKPAEGNALCAVRLAALRARAQVLRLKTHCPRLRPGLVLEVSGGEDHSLDGPWLLVGVEAHAQVLTPSSPESAGQEAPAPEAATAYDAATAYTAELEAVPLASDFRPDLAAPAPCPGVQTMQITGPSGEEVHTEEHGRVRAHYRWDRRRPWDDQSSAWMRVSQPATSGGFLLPRVGWEQLTAFWQDSATPVALGRLYNGEAPPPSPLPAERTVSAFGTRTSPGGGSFNGLVFNDTAGSESMAFTASYDLNERTEADKVTSIAGNEAVEIAGQRATSVGQVASEAIAADQSTTVGSNRTLSVEANAIVESGEETVRVGGARVFQTAGDLTTQATSVQRWVAGAKGIASINGEQIYTAGASVRHYHAHWVQRTPRSTGVDVLGASTVTVVGTKTVDARAVSLMALSLKEECSRRREEVGGNRMRNADKALCLDVAKDLTIDSGEMSFQAEDKLVIKAGNCTVTLKPEKIVIDAKYRGDKTSVDSGDESYD